MRRGFTTNSSSANEWIPSTGGAQQAPNNLTQNIYTALGVVGFVIIMFITEKVVKKVYRKWKEQRSD
jgi:hypothetical protein